MLNLEQVTSPLSGLVNSGLVKAYLKYTNSKNQYDIHSMGPVKEDGSIEVFMPAWDLVGGSYLSHYVLSWESIREMIRIRTRFGDIRLDQIESFQNNRFGMEIRVWAKINLNTIHKILIEDTLDLVTKTGVLWEMENTIMLSMGVVSDSDVRDMIKDRDLMIREIYPEYAGIIPMGFHEAIQKPGKFLVLQDSVAEVSFLRVLPMKHLHHFYTLTSYLPCY